MAWWRRAWPGGRRQEPALRSADDAVRRSVRSRRPLLDMSPRCDASVYLTRVARKLAQPDSSQAAQR